MLVKYLVVINLLAFLAMFWDKHQARVRGRRIPEGMLLGLAVILGATGILAGMYVFHHKTKHNSFKYGIPSFLIINLLLIGQIF